MVQSKYEEADLVRIVEPDGTFRKCYKQNYTVFTLFNFATLSPSTCNLVDANGVLIGGKFHESELVQVKVLPIED